MFQLSNLLENVHMRQVLIGVVCLSILAFLYYSFIYEGFDKDACTLTAKGAENARKTMSKIDNAVGETNRDKLNLDINYRDMQTRDIILGEDSKSWCHGLSKEDVQKLIDENELQLDDNAYLFDNTQLMDVEEQASINAGIEYAGAHKYKQRYAEA